MKVVIAFDSFKGSISSMEAGMAAREGILSFDPEIEAVVRPMADGGEGTVDTLVEGLDGKFETVLVTGPLMEKVTARYGIINGDTAVMEMSSAAGLTLVPKEMRAPQHTTTYGVGEMIIDALDKGIRRFLIGIGGSATNDGGAGMLQALGFDLTDGDGRPIPPGAMGLKELSGISTANARPELRDCRFYVACDVDSPLCGERGCSRVFAPQKGATPEMIEEMDVWLRKYAELAKSSFPQADPEIEGSGAAGGLGFALRTFLGAELKRGSELVIRETNLEKYMEGADLVITGEGRMDAQTAMGKTPVGVAHLAKQHGIPVVALVGSIGEGAYECNREGIDAIFSIVPGTISVEEAMKPEVAKKNLADTARQVIALK